MVKYEENGEREIVLGRRELASHLKEWGLMLGNETIVKLGYSPTLKALIIHCKKEE